MSLSRAEETGLIDLVREVAKAEILPRFRALEATDIRAKSRADDLVTVADVAAEAALTDGAARILPGAAVVGEEAVSADASILDRVGGPGRTLVIDPIDGTWNFAHGLAVFGVILAVVEDGETVFGLLYDPVFDDWIAARRSGGAWSGAPGRADVPLRSTPAPPPEVAQGYVPLSLYPPQAREGVARAMATMGRAGTLRCACHEYRQLVSGGSDFMLAAKLNVWDHAAGVLAVTEAGGHAALAGGAAYAPDLRRGHLISAADADLWQALDARFGAAAGLL
ncbi:inositol monophosphatase family protein [Histidinibacterium lentulum]|uniref:Inositol monophosphatase n=1 Tax=Histidinibacterium lentulum TaxID=2480588 RepID=A0A3N2QY56_9RHOB|nr:inositol monophosphatase [Histidinibacterium lentulum]ROU00139.1 inositol monophosphatase [Histidinibacterium lentulum]